jgi:cytochrome b involved in lipid metabolism
MNKKIISVLLVVLVLGGIGAYVALSKKAASDYTSTGTQTQTETPVTSAPHETTNGGTNPAGGTTVDVSVGTTPTSYTMAQVAMHANASSCWTAINGNVYDVTTWINKHPGGAQAVLSLCGKDGSAAFDDQHGGQRRPENELEGFKIGALAA